MACRMDYVLLLFAIIHDRLLEKKGQEKKHEKKNSEAAFNIYMYDTMHVHSMAEEQRKTAL